MDDLKLYAGDEKSLDKIIRIVHSFSHDIGMDFGLEKCAKCIIKGGKKVPGQRLEIEEGKFVEDLEHDATYKYLGIEENSTFEHKNLRRKATQEYLRRLKKICRSELSAKHKITAINQMALPVLNYGFGIIDWPQKDIDNLDVKTRKVLTMHNVIYRHQCMDRVYLPRREGGLGLIEINDAMRSTIINLSEYLVTTTDNLLLLVKRHHQNNLSEHKSVIKLADIFKKENNIGTSEAEVDNTQERNVQPEANANDQIRLPKNVYMETERVKKRERWKENKRAGMFYQEIQKSYIDQKGSFLWLQNGALTFNEERLLVSAQDQGIMTNGLKKVCKLTNDDKCRFCHKEVESPSHLMSGCQTLLAEGHYTRRHNKVCRYLHWQILNDYNIPTKEVWLHEPEPVTAKNGVTVFYDKIIPCGRFIESGAVKPDLVVWDEKEKTALIIDVCVPNDFGINRAEREKVTKYQDLKNALKETWNLKSIEVIPIIIGATGVMKDNLQGYLDSIPGKSKKYEVQIAAIRGTVSILKRALGSHFL